MFQKVSAVVLVFGLLVQVLNLREPYLFGDLERTGHLFSCGFQGLMFLVYPLLGHVADVCLNRYRIVSYHQMVFYSFNFWSSNKWSKFNRFHCFLRLQ